MRHADSAIKQLTADDICSRHRQYAKEHACQPDRGDVGTEELNERGNQVEIVGRALGCTVKQRPVLRVAQNMERAKPLISLVIPYAERQFVEIIKALVMSYDFAPMSVAFNPQSALVDMTDTISESFMVMIRLGSPFIAYAILVNLGIGFVNKLVPQIPVYFISLPFVILTNGPRWFAGLAVVWLGLLSSIILLWRHPFSPWLAVGIAFTHALGGSSWLAREGSWGWVAAIVYLGFAAEFSRWCWRRSGWLASKGK